MRSRKEIIDAIHAPGIHTNIHQEMELGLLMDIRDLLIDIRKQGGEVNA